MRLSALRIGLVVCALLSFSGSSGCATGAGQRPPDVAIAQTSTAVVQAATNLQTEVNRLTAAGTLPVSLGQKFTDANKVLASKAVQLSSALDAYHLATAADRGSAAAKVQALITELSGPLSEMLGLKLPAGAAQSVSKLLGNVMSVVGAIQGEIARGLQGDPSPAALLRWMLAPPIQAVA